VQRVRAVRQGPAALAVIGECGADDEQLRRALEWVRDRDWRALTCWPGSYLVIARTGGTLAVIGDLSGQHPVYWRPYGGGVWWATAQTALAALDGAPVDPLAMAARLATAQPDVLAERSLFRSVRRVPPGQLLLCDAAGPRPVRYEPAEPNPVGLAEAAPVVRAALTEAVAVRLDGRAVSADLAGLDSTTLACLAAQRGPVRAVTFADARLRDDDLVYAARTAATVPGLNHRVVPGGRETVYYSGLDDLGALPLTDAPNAYSVTAAIKRAVLDAVAEIGGAGVHLTGAAGDGVLSASPSYLADLLRQRRYRTAWHHALGHARMRHTAAWTVWRQARPASRLLLPGAWRAAAAELRRAPGPWVPQAQQPTAWTPLLATAGWMDPALRAQLADELDAAADALDPVRVPCRLAVWEERQDLMRVGADTCGWREIAAAYGIDLAAPYLDNEVLRAAWAVPAEQRGAPTRYKPLLAAAFTGRGVVPAFVLARTTKGGFNAVAYAGLVEHAPVLRELLGASSRLAALGLISDRPVAGMLQRAAAGQPVAQGALHAAVAAEVWLRQYENHARAGSSWWEVADHVGAA
jgi:asparagine synthase (glutamine-hydrolysing)